MSHSDIQALQSEVIAAIGAAQDSAALDAVRVEALGKKGKLTELMKILPTLPAEERKAFGAAVNVAKEAVTQAIDIRQKVLGAAALNARLEKERLDVTLSARPDGEGRVHPITQTMNEIVTIFAAMGFSVAKGPDIETDWNNFTALNLPPDHPARQMQDTFYMPQDGEMPMVLRTHTSPVQIRTMLKDKPPIRIIAPGRTYRCDYDMTHTPMFHQFEGLVIDEKTNMGHLKGCLLDFLRAFFGIDDLPLRFRPSYFPFTEPSAEVDIGCSRKGGELKLGNYGDWLEIGGCGMVNAAVLRNCGVDPDKYQGFAFGTGIERLAMLKYGIPDLRTFFEADIRWLKHYGFVPLDIPNPALAG
ncbi:MAG: phenylalanine--tRNA ligase subunit alpha [Proteobacteria bacterium]|jgi:phenylalanyl-tRNA synthetase alpha chain|nr:phenylalanine--tRNA ligase subunit alpha [Alphaproteobacteria bacterium]NCC04145.1 phenylalanine--tRNA ligase subunit alpha [Pseudomonadota bacterium]